MTIVVGVDHTTESGQALDLAVQEADLRGADLRIVHVGEPAAATSDTPVENAPEPAAVPSSSPTTTIDRSTSGQAIIDEALARARRTLPPDRISGEVVPGRPARVLVEQVTELDLLVVGSRNPSTARSVLLGSVGSAASAHAPCPVFISRYRAGWTPPTINRVLAGTDRSHYAARTLEFAFAEAQLRDVPLDVVCCWQQHGFLTPYEQRQVTEELRDELENDISDHTRRYPGVRAAGDVFEGRAATILAARADEATLLVVGARGAGGTIGSLVLGSVSQHVLHYAHDPVAVVRPPR